MLSHASHLCGPKGMGRGIGTCEVALCPYVHVSIHLYAHAIAAVQLPHPMHPCTMHPCALAQVTGQLPFPLSYIIPWNQRKEVVRRYTGIDPAEVCVGGADGEGQGPGGEEIEGKSKNAAYFCMHE